VNINLQNGNNDGKYNDINHYKYKARGKSSACKVWRVSDCQ